MDFNRVNVMFKNSDGKASKCTGSFCTFLWLDSMGNEHLFQSTIKMNNFRNIMLNIMFFLVGLQWDQVVHKVSDWNYDF